ncbi:transmembrane protein 98 [Exaiptasia diaphana]|uniref:Transmembrane protein 98 n=1 Tax=Exaiptasia diaphana TaxID=2652724 RepID=A0A913XQ35_EXADI|nr:transmembrane protein 98 [Exaiptasia diaphana]KXJ09844.1 Transmembrane protein 98 [Exaiptasia diaphana]
MCDISKTNMALHVMIIAIALLAVIFMASFVALLVICKHKCGKLDFTVYQNTEQYENRNRKQVELIGANYHDTTSIGESTSSDHDLSDVFLDPDWGGDAESLVCHCVAVLKTCHHLTDKLVAYTVENGPKINCQDYMKKIVTAARNISPKVDELVEAMYTPSDSRQIEDKSSALFVTIFMLLQIIKGISDNADLTWADDMIYTIEQHIEAMRRDSQPDPNLLANNYQRSEPLKDGKHGLCFVNRTFLS